MNILNYTTRLAAFCAAPAFAMAQVDSDFLRTRTAELSLQFDGAGADDRLEVDGHTGAQVTANWLDSAGTLRTGVNLPFDRIANVFELFPGYYLVVGTEYSNGVSTRTGGAVILHCELDSGGNPAIQQSAPEMWPGRDPARIYRKPGTNVYWMLDYESRELLAAEVQGPGYVPSASQWVVVADRNSIPMLHHAVSVHFAAFGHKGDSEVRFGSLSLSPDTQYALSFSGGTGSATPVTGGVTAAIRDHEFTTGLQGVQFRCDASVGASTYELYSPDDTLLTSGAVLPGSWVTTPAVPQMFANPAGPYRLEFPGAKAGLNIHPSVRYQPAASTSSDFTVGRAVQPPRLRRGMLRNGNGIEIETTMNGTVTAYQAVALRRPDGSDPIATSGNGAPVLEADTAIQFAFQAEDVRNSIGRELPIADDGMLEGQVVLFQYWLFLPDGSIAVSEVFGNEILPSLDPNPAVVGFATPLEALLSAAPTQGRLDASQTTAKKDEVLQLLN